jgi:hypothetical protein
MSFSTCAFSISRHALARTLSCTLAAAGLFLALSPAAFAQTSNGELAAAVSPREAVGLTIRNAGLLSLRIDIPGVMQANFSPMSDSGATLQRGQELYFQYRGKRTLLTRIDTQKPGDVLLINEIVAKRRAELDKLPENAVAERQPG